MWPLKTAEPDQARFQNRLMIRLESHHKTDNDTFTPSHPLRGGGAPPRPGTWPPQLVTPGNCWSHTWQLHQKPTVSWSNFLSH